MSNEKNTWGGKRPGSGRKEGAIIDPEQKKAHRIVVMCTKEQNDRFTQKAKEEGLTTSGYLLKKANKGELKMTLNFKKIIELHKKNSDSKEEVEKKKAEDYLKKIEKEYPKYIDILTDELSDNKIVNAKDIKAITSSKKIGYEVTFQNNKNIAKICLFLQNHIKCYKKLKDSWGELTIKEFGYAIVGKKCSLYEIHPDKPIEIMNKNALLTLYFIDPDNMEFYEKKFSELS